MDLKAPTTAGLGLASAPKTWIPIEQRETVDEIKRHLASPDRLHGANSQQILVYGPSGSGKRQIATRAAEEIVASDGRKLLVVDGHTFEMFIRDFYNLYLTLTGQQAPPGLTCTAVISKVKGTLERRRNEWLMLLIDVVSSMDEGGPLLHTYLPKRGQIIMTCSNIMRYPARGAHGSRPKFMCDLELTTKAHLVCVPGLSLTKSFDTIAPAPGFCAAPVTKSLRKLHGPAYPTIMFLRVVAASLLLLNVSTEAYVTLHRAKSGQRLPRHNALASAKSAFHVAMHILWQTLADRDVWSTKLLAALAIADSVTMPLELLRALPILNPADSDSLSPALHLLASLQLVRMTRTHHDGEVIISHPQILRWVRVYIKQAYPEKEHSALVHSWVETIAGSLEVDHGSGVAGAQSWWKLNPIIWNIVHACACRKVSSRELLGFLIDVAELIIEDRRLISYAGIFIIEAQRIWNIMFGSESSPALSDKISYVRIKHVLARVMLDRDEITRAGLQLSLAKHHLSDISTSMSTDSLTDSLLSPDTLDEIEAELSLAQGRSLAVEDLLDRMLGKPTATPAMLAKYHNWMAEFLTRVGWFVPALQHSHATMMYWSQQPKDVRDGKKDIMTLTWLETHANLLIKLQKSRGALLFLTKLLDIWYEVLPARSIGLWRIAAMTLCCYSRLEEVTAAEKVAIRMLEWSPIDEISNGDALRLAMLFLHELADIYLCHGRYIEAEGISRFNLMAAKKGTCDGLFDDDRVPTDWWLQLVYLLTQQGRHAEARRVRDEYQNGEHGEEFINEMLSRLAKKVKRLRDMYQRAVWAEEDGMLTEWKMLLSDEEQLNHRVAVRQFGDIPTRVRAGRPAWSETDPHHYALARESRVLHLLGYVLRGTSFIGHSDDDRYDVFPERQHLIYKYLSCCQFCRRYRPRSSSFRGITTVAAPKSEEKDIETTTSPARKLRQTHVDDYFFIMVPPPPAKLSSSCPPDCPCRDATLRGIAESAALEQKLWTLASSPESASASASASAFSFSPPPWPDDDDDYTDAPPTFIKTSEAPDLISDEEAFITHEADPSLRCWRVVHTEFSLEESVGENYIIPHSVHMPIIIITPPPEEEDGGGGDGGSQQERQRRRPWRWPRHHHQQQLHPMCRHQYHHHHRCCEGKSTQARITKYIPMIRKQ